MECQYIFGEVVQMNKWVTCPLHLRSTYDFPPPEPVEGSGNGFDKLSHRKAGNPKFL